MKDQNYEYRSLMAKTWDFFRGDMSEWEDRFFYRELIGRYGGPVLDVGCGTGRLLLDYMADGINVDGLDNSPEMLAICRQKAEELGLEPRLYEGEITQTWHRYRHICTFPILNSGTWSRSVSFFKCFFKIGYLTSRTRAKDPSCTLIAKTTALEETACEFYLPRR